jgi:hypothetical protein
MPFDTAASLLRRTMDGIRRSFGTQQEAPTPCGSATSPLLQEAGSGSPFVMPDFACGFRRSEIVALDVEDLAFDKERLKLRSVRTKTDQDGKG